MAPPPRQRRRRLLAAAGLLVLLSLCCLASLGGAASAASAAGRAHHREDGATTATEKGAGQEAARGFTAATGMDEAVPVRVEMEVDVQDYPGSAANARHEPGWHDPGYPFPRGPQHPWHP